MVDRCVQMSRDYLPMSWYINVTTGKCHNKEICKNMRGIQQDYVQQHVGAGGVASAAVY